jgi:hypothetical protein
MRPKLTEEIFDSRISGRPIKRLGEYTGIFDRIPFQCLIEDCNNIWIAIPNNILIGRGCPKCKVLNRTLTNAIIDANLVGHNIKRLGDYINSKTPISVQCLIESCQYIWKTRVNHIINDGSGCPKCSKTLELTNELIDERLLLQDRHTIIKRLGDCIGCSKKIDWLCLICSTIWAATPTNIINHHRGCPICMYKNEKIIYTILKDYNIVFDYHKRLQDFNIEYPNFILDFYISDCKCIIEYNGPQHYKPVRFNGISYEQAKINLHKQQKRDQELYDICKNNDYNLIVIDGRTLINNKLKMYIINTIIPLIRK